MATANHPVDTSPVCSVPLTRPFIWWGDGWDDLLRHRGASRLGVAKTLSLLALVWFDLSGSPYLGLLDKVTPSLATTLWGEVTQQLNNSQVLAYFVVGLLLAAVVFSLSVATIPMIIERHVDAGTACA